MTCESLGIPPEWNLRCEDAAHFGHDDSTAALALRMENLQPHFYKFADKMSQLGSYGGGNHFGECEVVQIQDKETVNNHPAWVHRKGATRAFPCGHFALQGTPFAETGHPILLPGNPQAGSAVMVADDGATLSCYSINHGAGRRLGRRAAKRTLDQAKVDRSFEKTDILTNCRTYPIDEAPEAYKDFNEVLRSVKLAGLATEIARLKARFVIKDGDKADD